MGSIELKNITKSYDNKKNVIEDLNLKIPDGSFTVLIGPSGCGKTTTLRLIVGLEEPTSGEVYIDDKSMEKVEPGDRDIAMVFQNYALYPTMNVRENIEFGLINNKVKKEERDKLVTEIAEIVGLEDFLQKKPGELSGGQRQRVALARAMVKKPKVFIMDEPLSNLDAKLRAQMRIELSELHQKMNTTFVYVTHDQTEAMSMATNIILMNDGAIQQHDTPEKLYEDPANLFTAEFIGSPSMNTYEINEIPDYNPPIPEAKYVGFRPSAAEFILNSTSEKMNKNDLIIKVKIITREYLGSEIIYNCESGFGKVYFKTFQKEDVSDENEITLYLPEQKLFYFDEEGKRVHI
ncbi:ABC transporter ATP-binding protein [Oceanobacillus sp. HCA-5259]|uniref:ABC transporter ATP-binding protein n=1 Tax=Oceanobacillus sp. HCA-5259 TaxID=3134661 RepID=UPI0030BBDCE6